MTTKTLAKHLVKKTAYYSTVLFITLLNYVDAQSQSVLGAWDFRGEGGYFTTVSGMYPGDQAASGIQLSSLRITTGPGFIFRNYLGNGFTVQRQNTTTLGDAIAQGDYISFRIAPASGRSMSITSVKLRPIAEGGQRNFTLFSSRNGFSSGNQLGNTLTGAQFGSELVNYTIANHTGITSEIEFRVYIWGNFGNISQAVGIGNKNTNQTGFDLIIEGSTASSGGSTFTPSVLPEMQVGMGSVHYYTNPIFANALYIEDRGWMQNGSFTTYDPSSPQFDSNGYPKYLNTVSGAVVPVFMQPGQNDGNDVDVYYRGRITLTWEGDADIRIPSGANCISGNCTGRLVNGTRVYTTPGTGGINGITVRIQEINNSNYPKKVRCWLPDPTDPYGKSLMPINGVEQIWHPQYLATLNKPEIGVLRFMDMGVTNGNPLINWSERRTSNHCSMGAPTVKRIPLGASTNDLRNSGIAYEMMIDLANRLNKDAWICVPHGATNDYMTQMARLFRDNLSTSRKLYIEYSNEVWACAGSFPQGCYVDQQASAAGINKDVWIGRKFAEMWSIFQREFGSANRLVRVITNQTGNAGRFQTTIQASIDHGNTQNPVSKPDILSPTTYFGNDIQRFVFERLNYKTPTTATYDSAFVEWESRILNSEASQTGRDFTGGGGGFPIQIVNYSKQYNLPIVPYEGGTGLQFADFIGAYTTPGLRCSTYTSAGTAGTQQMELAVLAGECSGGNANASPYHTFMYNMSKNPKIKTMFYLHNSLAKAKGVRTISQFGDISAESKYGIWGHLLWMGQPIATAYKYQHTIEFSAEQATIREIDDSVGTRPRFTTLGELTVGKVNNAYNANIDFTGGNGALTATILGSARLSPGLSIAYQSNRINISGTPTQSGTYRLLVRVLDGDRDVAYSVFTVRILPAPKNLLMAHETFGSSAGQLHNSNNGSGFNAPWSVQNSNTTAYTIATSSPLSYSGLFTTGGGYGSSVSNQSLTAGRALRMSSFDYLVKSTNTNVVGQTNSSLFSSFVVRRESGAQNTAYVYLNNGGFAASANESRLRIGVSGNNRWAIWVRNAANSGFDLIETSITANNGSNNLIVAEVAFGNTNDVIRLWVNPTALGGTAPAATLTYTTTFTGSTVTGRHQDMEFNTVGFYGSSNSGAILIDDIRFGDTYRAVTPTSAAREETEESTNVSETIIYPNPATSILNIQTSLQNASLQIADLSGKVVLTKSLSNEQHQSIDISTLSAGIYIINISSEKESIVKKLVRE